MSGVTSPASQKHPKKRGDGFAKARQVYADSFESEEARRAHYSEIGKKGRGTQVIFKLTEQERAALSTAYQLLGRIAERANIDVFNSEE